MPIEKTIKLFKFGELDEHGKRNAIEWYRSLGDCFSWGEDYMASLQGFADWFGLRIRNYSLGGSDNRNQHVDFELDVDYNVEELHGVRLWKWLNNQFTLPDLSGECPFTGYCFDEILLDTIREFVKCPNMGTTYRELMRDSIDAFCTNYAADVDYQHSDEAIAANIECNEYWFHENGDRE